MFGTFRLAAAAGLALVLSTAARAESHLMRYADIHDNQIVFTYEDDLWLADAAGGPARRLTSDPGAELWAKFSPDGRSIAFTAQYDGGTDIYLLPTAGGVPRRLTYQPAAERMLGWWPDGQSIYYRANFEYPFRGERVYRLAIDGGLPEPLPVDRAGLAAISPDGQQIAYNRITREHATWKRYQGGMAQQIWLGRLADRDYRIIAVSDWTSNFPMWEGDVLYFSSDRQFGTLNLYKYDLASGRTTALTQYKDYDVKYPSSGPGAIIYQYGESLHVLDLRTGQARLVPVEVPSDLVRMRTDFVGVAPASGSFGLSPTGVRVLLEARGEILNLPAKDGEPINLTRSSGSREKNAAWSPNGRWIAFLSDRSGEEEVCLVDQKGSAGPAEGTKARGPEGTEEEAKERSSDGATKGSAVPPAERNGWRQLTQGGLGFRMHLVWSPDSRYLLFSDKFMRLNLVDAQTGTLEVLDTGEYDDAWERWGIQDYVWSPDSRWIAYTKMEQTMHDSIFLYSLDQRRSFRLTSDQTQDWSPSFDPEGRYLYFLSNRTFDPLMCAVDQNHIFLNMARPYAVVLAADAASPFAPKDSAEEIKDAEPGEPDSKPAAESAESETKPAETRPAAATDKNAAAAKDAKPEEKSGDEKKPAGKKKETKIDLDGIERRIVVVDNVPAGNYFRLEATKKGFLYLSKPEPEFTKYQVVTDHTGGSLDLYSYDLEKRETTKVLGGIANYHLSADGKKLVYRAGSSYGVVDAGSAAKVGDGKVELGGVRLEIDRAAEFRQMFDEAWRIQRDWFYDPGLHGVDWPAMREKYGRFLPYCGNRSDLNYLIGEMIAELNIGHTYVSGGDAGRGGKSVATGLLGVEFAVDPGVPYYRIARIIPGTPGEPKERSPLEEPGCPIRAGHYLLAIDGQPVTTAENVYKHLQNKANAVVTLTWNDRPEVAGAKTYRVRTIASENGIRYREWVERNRRYVAEKSGGRLGYLHIPDMGENGLIEFARAWYPQYAAQGFIIDERYNGGGFTGDMIIDRLERKLWGLTQPREGKCMRDPERGFHGPWAVLINEDTGSNGEFFAEAIKLKKLAPVIGMRTWGGAIGIEAHQDLVDGGSVTPPQFGLYGLAGTWLIEGRGVEPDIEVQNMPADVLRGVDAQLDRAIQVVLDELARDPHTIPSVPAYPDKSKKTE